MVVLRPLPSSGQPCVTETDSCWCGFALARPKLIRPLLFHPSEGAGRDSFVVNRRLKSWSCKQGRIRRPWVICLD